MENIRDKILSINRRTDIDSNEKNRLINELMSSNYKPIKKTNIKCEHYDRNCKIECFDCKKIYPCRFCHDENEDHELNRSITKNMVCSFCDKFQECSQTCIECNKSMSTYYCSICKLFTSNTNISHCDKCGICRIGTNLKHCDKCNMCFNEESFDTHKCIDCFDDTCPFCQEDIRNSREQNTILACNHVVHINCLKESLQSGNYQCPLCKKSMTDMTYLWTQIENYMSNCEMPDEYDNMESSILCNDCLKKSKTKFHFSYHKCIDCNSWNTSVLDTYKI